MHRRDFLGALSATAAIGCTRAMRGASTPAPVTPARTSHAMVPASNIAVRTEYPPIAPLASDVFQRRLDRARELTRSAGATVLVATSGGTNFRYLVGSDYGRSERLVALLLPVDGDPQLIAPSFEAERVRRGARISADVHGWEEQDDPFALVRTSLGAGRGSAAIAVEPKTEYWTAMRIARAMPNARLVDGTAIFEQLRLVKTPEEIVRMRRAIEITEDAIAATFARIQPGMHDVDIANVVADEHSARGVTGGGLVQLGPQSALPHGGTIGTELRDGMVVLIDAGCQFQGYTSDITRTRWFGDSAPAKFREVYNIVHAAQDAAMAKVAPGVPAQELDRAARAVITRAGYGQYFTHRLGHGMGMDGHEPTWNVEGNTTPLQPGFVFSVEPGIYMLNEFGVRIEDDFMCTDRGGELLSRRAPTV